MNQDYNLYDSTSLPVEKITGLIQIMEQNQHLSPEEQLAIMTKIRQELSNDATIQNSDLLRLMRETMLINHIL
jgi:hypothetical protein